jgi:hypothetical protein
MTLNINEECKVKDLREGIFFLFFGGTGV